MSEEARIRGLLREGLDSIEVPVELPEASLHRAKHRRMAITLGAASLVTIVLASAVYSTTALMGDRRSVGPSSESPTPADHEVPATEVGQGTVAGQTWTLVAYEGADGLCVDLEVGGGTSNVCGFDVPNQRDLGINESSQRGVARTAIHGVVSKGVHDLQVTLNDGEQIDVDIIQGPTGFDVNFFAAFLPPEAEAVVEARGSNGTLLESRQISPLPGRPD